jgi:hypothetical protein
VTGILPSTAIVADYRVLSVVVRARRPVVVNKKEALDVLRQRLAPYQDLSYADLEAKIGQDDWCDVAGPSGTQYQVEVQVIWEKGPRILVLGSVDDGGPRRWFPLCETIVRAPGQRCP